MPVSTRRAQSDGNTSAADPYRSSPRERLSRSRLHRYQSTRSCGPPSTDASNHEPAIRTICHLLRSRTTRITFSFLGQRSRPARDCVLSSAPTCTRLQCTTKRCVRFPCRYPPIRPKTTRIDIPRLTWRRTSTARARILSSRPTCAVDTVRCQKLCDVFLVGIPQYS